MVYRTYWGFYGCWNTFHCCSTNTSSLLWELWSRASDEQGRSLIIRSDGWGPELSQGGAGEGWGRMNIRQEGWWEIEGKWERKSGWGRFTGHVMEGEKDEQRKTSEPPQRRTRLTNYLLLHYRACQRGRLCQAAHTPRLSDALIWAHNQEQTSTPTMCLTSPFFKSWLLGGNICKLQTEAPARVWWRAFTNSWRADWQVHKKVLKATHFLKFFELIFLCLVLVTAVFSLLSGNICSFASQVFCSFFSFWKKEKIWKLKWKMKEKEFRIII